MMQNSDDYLAAVERLLQMPPEEASEVMRELRSHYYELHEELVAMGMSDNQVDREANLRLGKPEYVASQLRAAHCQSTWCNLFPPKDFIATSAFWGFWAGGVLAGINYIRMGRRNLGYKVIAAAVLVQTAVLFLFSHLERFTGTGLFDQPGTSEPSLHLNTYWLVISLSYLAINAAAGFMLFRAQNRAYSAWAAIHPPRISESPYLAWWISLLAILGAVAICLIVGTMFIRWA